MPSRDPPAVAWPWAAFPVADAPARRIVFHPDLAGGRSRAEHDLCTKAAVTQAIGALLDMPYAGDLAPEVDARPLDAAPRPYVVPSDTLTCPVEAARLGIRSTGDLFGGVVPHAFVASKVITHGLVDAGAAAPDGWSAAMGERVKDVVLPGYAAFDLGDARLAGRRLLASGAVRVKEAGGVGGSGQVVVHDAPALDAALASIDPEVLRCAGVVLERNLAQVETLSVGQVQIGAWLASYVGVQHATRNHRGHEVYGGSTLDVVRGDWNALLAQPLSAAERLAVEQALAYDLSAQASYPGLVVSRRNYDVAQGIDAAGRWHSGVLEQSWRIGGASGAEVVALHAFRADPPLAAVRASTREVYADGVAVPAGALVLYDGIDARVGRLVKYARLEPHVDL